METVATPDGRTLEFLVEGPSDGPVLVLHAGTPSGATRCAPIFDPALRLGYRVVLPGRPGYGGSTPQPGRQVASAAADVAVLLEAIGAAEFVTLGWSGGGPHALACAAVLPGRCRAVATVAGVAPYPSEGLDWLEGMGEENKQEFAAAFAGESALEAFLSQVAPAFAGIRADQIVAGFGDLLSEVDQKALAGGLAEYLAEASRYSVSTGIAGWRDDDLAFASPWGFELAEITQPVAIWQGDQDRMVPGAHGRYLAAHLPTAVSHFEPGEGHLSLVADAEQILRDLAELR